MTWNEMLPLLVLVSSLAAGVAIFLLREDQRGLRTTLNIAAALVKLVLIAVVAHGVSGGERYELRIPFLPGSGLLLRADPFSLLFMSLSAVLWLATTVYAVGYLEHSTHRSRFFGFFALCVSSTMGIALAGNLVTFFLFYELLTLSTFPLVVHRGTASALAAGASYLRYTITAGVVLLAGVVLVTVRFGALDFAERGVLSPYLSEDPVGLTFCFVLLIAGLAVKAAIVPVHGWLPTAMVAPAPVSALLHAVAVVKAGAFGIARVVYNVFGARLSSELGVLRPLAFLAAATIVYGSLRALYQRDLKRRLAYSTVSQVSFIVLGVAILGPLSTTGGLAHIVHQGLLKITLFFCAGNLAEELGLHRVDELKGVGRRMPFTMAAFTLAALGMIGLPPLPGFVTKWYLGLGALAAGEPWVLAVLVASTLLNAAYFLPIVYAAWLVEQDGPWGERSRRAEAPLTLLLPTLATALLALAAGLFANTAGSPLGWAKEIAARELRP